MAPKFSLDDYVDVAERIAQFHAKHPDGSLQTLTWDVRDVAGKTFIVYRAAAYRSPEDKRPGHGTAWEPFPGPTQYTRDSELMNAETAAWGRALVAIGFIANRKIASRQEVEGRQSNGDAFSDPVGQITEKQRTYLERLIRDAQKAGMTPTTFEAIAAQHGVRVEPGWIGALPAATASKLIETFKAGVDYSPESDIPTDAPPAAVVGDDSDLPFEAA